MTYTSPPREPIMCDYTEEQLTAVVLDMLKSLHQHAQAPDTWRTSGARRWPQTTTS